MKLSSFVNQISQNYMEITGQESSSSLEQGLKNGLEALMGKQPGQSVAGEVLLRNGSDILISMGENQLLQAKLEGNMSAQPGQILTFQLKSVGDGKAVLSPLFENTAQDPNVSRALQAAGLPQTSAGIEMVKSMMEEGMSIDRQSLYQMNRIVNNYPEADIRTLVQLQRLEIPVTENNIAQFEAYKNYQHQLGDSLLDISDAFSRTFQELTGNEDPGAAASFYQEVVNIMTGENAADGLLPGALAEAGKENTDTAMMGNMAAAENTAESAGKEIPLFSADTPSVLSGEELEQLTKQLQQLGAPDKLTKAVQSGSLSGKEFLNRLGELLEQQALPDKEKLLSLFDGKPFKQILKNEMNNQWLMLPEEVAEERSVDKLYERLTRQMSQLNEALGETAKGNTPLARTITNVQGNIDFMNQLNQMFTYVQIPLKMNGREASGELFVYANKKHAMKDNDSVSALLHLDMEHLGSVDVHVALKDKKVSTQFYLQDEQALELVAGHIGLLNERLEKRGYSMSAQFINKEERTNVMEEILAQGKNISILSTASFDARA